MPPVTPLLLLSTVLFSGHVQAECAPCSSIEGFVPPSEISKTVRRMVGKSRRKGAAKNVAIQKQRGVIETGLTPQFIQDADCPEIDSEQWAIDYSHKRNRPALHKGIDIPQPRGTPILAIADGMVVGKFLNQRNRKGIELMLRHTPEQSGLPFWSYSQYTHLQALPELPIGTSVKMGSEIGKTANTGKMGRRVRRDALHFAVLYSEQPEWSNDGSAVTPKEGYFMDPIAFYRPEPPYASEKVLKLSREEKKTPVPYLDTHNRPTPSTTRRIWPYRCSRP